MCPTSVLVVGFDFETSSTSDFLSDPVEDSGFLSDPLEDGGGDSSPISSFFVSSSPSELRVGVRGPETSIFAPFLFRSEGSSGRSVILSSIGAGGGGSGAYSHLVHLRFVPIFSNFQGI